jgi:Cytochrome c554 and c-prime
MMCASRSQVWLAAAGLLLLVCSLIGSGQEQQPKAKPGDGPRALYYGEKTCAGGHSFAKPEDVRGPPPIVCRCNEAIIWEKEDKHRLAYTNVFNPGGRGDQIVKLLHYSKSDVDKNCVVCHGVYIPPEKLEALTDSAFKRDQSEGVTCAVCHGAYEDWVDPHGSAVERRRKEWRLLSRQAKEEKFGMTDLWDPAKRTRLCASCHVGNAREGKVVSHAMYAAGHPPLPSFEIATFSDAMPRHWQYLSQKSAEAKQLLGYNSAVLEQTQLVVIGAIAELEASTNLLADEAQRCVQSRDADSRVLDLSSFDCYACHHDLKTPSWRQLRGYSGKPGRPQFRPWPTALVRVALAAGQEGAKPAYEQFEKRLHAAFDARPFGEPAEVLPVTNGLRTWCRELEETLNRSPGAFDESASRRLVQRLCMLATTQVLDYDSARQLAWAFRVIYSELSPKPANDMAIQDKVKVLDEELKLSLPSGQQRQILNDLSSMLAKVADYDPARFKKSFEDLARLLPAN